MPGRAARQILETVFPRDEWSREFLDELDAECQQVMASKGPTRARIWYATKLVSPSTLHFLFLSRRRERRRDRDQHDTRALGIEWRSEARDAVRQILREPRTALLVALTLSLGIGSVSAMYGVADRLFLRGPPHVSQHAELARLFLEVEDPVLGGRTTPFLPYLTALALQEEVAGLDASTLYRFDQDLARVGDVVESLRVAEVDRRYFGVLGTTPGAGRFFDEGQADVDGDPVVLSYRLAQSAFGAAEAAVGRRVELTGGPRTVVAVARPGFSGPHVERVDAWVPARESVAGSRNWFVLARIPGFEGDQSQLAPLFAAAQSVHDQTDPGRFFQWAAGTRLVFADVASDDSGLPAAEASVARLLFVIMGLVLLLSCANAMNVLLVRGLRRRQEVAVRLALGSSQLRLARMFVAETSLLGMLGGLLSLPVSYIAGTFLQRMLLPQVAWGSSPIDVGVLAIASFGATGCGVVLGLLLSHVARGTDLSSGFTSVRASGGRRTSRAQMMLSTTQLALSASLLMCAGLFLQSFRAIRATDLGVRVDEVLVVGLESIDATRYRDGAEDEERVYQQALRSLRARDQTANSAISIGVPFVSGFGAGLWVPGLDSIPQLPGGGPHVSAVSGGYFDAMGTPIVRGSAISEEHVAEGAGVVVANETAARLLWPGEDPLGQCVRLGSEANPCSTLVGIAADVHRSGYRESESLQFYVPLGTQAGFSGMALLVRSAADNRRTTTAIRMVLDGIDPWVDYVDIAPLSGWLEAEVRPWRLGAVVLTVTSVLAAVVSLLGVYGVLAYFVTQRRQEIGVRLALGATGTRVRIHVLRSGLLSALVGILMGFGAVIAVGRWLQPLLFETSAIDFRVMSSVAVTLLGAATIASLVPASRAAQVAPADSLK